VRTRAAVKHRSVEAAPLDTLFSLRQPLALSDRARAPVWLASSLAAFQAWFAAVRVSSGSIDVAGRSTVPG
jgi:hypothetical protein